MLELSSCEFPTLHLPRKKKTSLLLNIPIWKQTIGANWFWVAKQKAQLLLTTLELVTSYQKHEQILNQVVTNLIAKHVTSITG